MRQGTYNRHWAIIARDVDNQWRIREVIAFDPDAAVNYYSELFPIFEVVAVGLLEGSGHPLIWLRDVEVMPIIPDWLPEKWRLHET